MTAYYNEIDPVACAALRELIASGVIADGVVDERSIKEVLPDDLRGFAQVHFFAGAGVWSAAARLAGWPDGKPLWTASCPCQPFSAVGKGLGADDPRHLWPELFRIIAGCREHGIELPFIVGEQVAGARGENWFDGVRADLATEDIESRTVDIPVCAVDGPHQRNRLWWVAVDNRLRARLEGQRRHGCRSEGRPGQAGSTAAPDGGLFGDPEGDRRREGRTQHELRRGRDAAAGADVQLQPDADGRGCARWEKASERHEVERTAAERANDGVFSDPDVALVQGQPSARQQPLAESSARALRNGSWWADHEWIVSPLDGKARRAKPGVRMLVDGMVGRIDLWRLAGNSISPILAAEVLGALLEAEEEAMTGNGSW